MARELVGPDEVVAELIHRIQTFVYPRRLRAKEYFLDHDPLKHGRCTLANFERGLVAMGVHLREEEVMILGDHFTESGPEIQEPQVVNYKKFCTAIDQIFANNGETMDGLMSSSPGSTLLTHIKKGKADEEKFQHMLHRIAALCKTRGVVLKECYIDHERAPIATPSRPNPRRGGKVTKSQFLRGFPFKKEFSTEEQNFIADHYTTDNGSVHFMALHHEVTEFLVHDFQPYPQSPGHVKHDSAQWSHKTLHPVDKLRAKIVERRVRVYEHFQDFDALRKGFCTVGQVKTVFTILNIGKELDKPELDALLNDYLREDGMFCYTEFCRDVESDFTTPYLEKAPLTPTRMPDHNTTALARRNKMAISAGRRQKIDELEEKLRYRIRTRGILLKPAFQDMDRTNRNYCTASQFERVLSSLGFNLADDDIKLLREAYCDLGNHREVNYTEFVKSVDRHPEDREIAMGQAQSPHRDFVPSKYFDHRGQVDRAAIGVMG